MLYSQRSITEDDQDRTLRTLEGVGRAPSRNKYSRRGQEEEQSQSSHEDLFLNLARTDDASGVEPLNRLDRRRVSPEDCPSLNTIRFPMIITFHGHVQTNEEDSQAAVFLFLCEN